MKKERKRQRYSTALAVVFAVLLCVSLGVNAAQSADNRALNMRLSMERQRDMTDVVSAMADIEVNLQKLLIASGASQSVNLLSETALLADARLLDDGSLRAGTRALICAAPTEYGGQLDTRVSSGKPLSLAEVERTRWGTVEGDANYFALWLADSYGEAFGGTATEYDSEGALFRAAAGGEVDAIVIRDDVRVDGAETWTGDGSIWKQLPVLDVTETVYTTVAAVDPELAEGAFAQALEQVLQRMNEEHSDLMTVLGAEAFAPVTEDGLTATRHLAALVEE